MEPCRDQSEISRLLRQIEQEYQAAQSALRSYAVISKHEFITARLECMGRIQNQIQKIAGDDAIRLIVERLEALSE